MQKKLMKNTKDKNIIDTNCKASNINIFKRVYSPFTHQKIKFKKVVSKMESKFDKFYEILKKSKKV